MCGFLGGLNGYSLILFIELIVLILVLYAYGFSKQDDPEKRT